MTTNNKNFINEVWKNVVFDKTYINKRKLQVSNYGRIRTYFNNEQNNRIIEGSKQEGYAIARLKMYEERPAETQQKLTAVTLQINELAAEILKCRQIIDNNSNTKNTANNEEIVEKEKQLIIIRKKFARLYKSSEKKRITYIGLLVHRLVAEYYCLRKTSEQKFVIHKDFNKLNNHYSNLQWATQEEVAAHQQNSPAVIQEKGLRLGQRRENSKASKLTVMRVMLIKKRLLENTPMRRLARQFKVTETQIARIKKGENWKDIPAAT